MNAMMPVSYRLFAAALADHSDARRPRPRSDKPAVIELVRHAEAPACAKAVPVTPRAVRFDSRLHA